MTMRLFVATCLTLFVLVTQDAHGFNLIPIDFNAAVVCPVTGDDDQQPQFNEPECHQVTANRIDPQNTAIWVKSTIRIPALLRDAAQPNAVYVSGKTSSRVYFNGQYLGQNGTPSRLAKDEFPGTIDTRFYVPDVLIKEGYNEIVLQLSSHHGFLSLQGPVNFIGFGSYDESALLMRQSLWLSLVPLGVLALAALYFLVMSFSPLNRPTHILLFLMSLIVSCQLLAEISRTLFSYSYPLHDVRLLTIVGMALSFGTCLLYYIAMKLELKRPWIWSMSGLLVTVLAVIATPGFDPKTTLAILIPTCICTALIAYQLVKQPSKERAVYFGVFLAFTAIVLVTLNRFHDIVFYYIITAILFFLFSQQALKLNREQKQRKAQQAQVAKLQFQLQQNQQQQQPQKISINSAGRTKLVSIEQLAYGKAAGDYVDLYLEGGKHLLFSGTLKDLEKLLPDTFFRVHRSYLVNLAYVQSLGNKSVDAQQTPAGGGFLMLSGGYEVPVSRRIMPMVRNAIK